MKLYRFSPIENQTQLFQAMEYLHEASYELCQKVYGQYLPNAGNIGIFCHYQDEYARLTKVREQLTEPSNNVYGKYFRLHQPFVIPARNDIPETSYTYLYIRQPDPYRSQVGDIDFYLEPNKYDQLKQSLENQKRLGLRRFERADPDMVELFDPDSDVLAYISNVKFADLAQGEKS